MAKSDDRIEFIITREFAKPRQIVWDAWSNIKKFQTWWGPKGCSIEVARFEFRPGGFFHYAMKFADAPSMWGRFNYREITTNERLTWLNSFANENCGIARAPFSERCPLEIENSASFTERAGKTIITLRAIPFGATEDERKYFEELHPSMQQGYGGTFDQLAEHLSMT